MDLLNELEQKIRKLRETGTEYAEAERDYKITLRQEALKLRNDEKLPVTLINQIIYGIPLVAEKRFQRDVKEAIYKANMEAINSVKLQIRVIENQLQREYTNTQ